MKKLALVAVFGSLLLGLMAPPAAADRPFEVTENVSFPDVNACTGEDHTVNITFDVKIHEHRNNFVVTVKSAVETSDGWVGGGTEAQVANGNVFSANHNIRVSNPETGQTFLVKGHFLFDIRNEEVALDTFRINCIGN